MALDDSFENSPAQRGAADLDARAERAQVAAPAGAPVHLPSELSDVEPFPVDALPDVFRPWVSDVAERMQCPPDFVAVPMLVGAAMLLARKVAIRPQEQTDWTERANLWAMIVGRPGVMKSPAMMEALKPLERMEARTAEVFRQAAAEHKAALRAEKLRETAADKEAAKVLKSNPAADVTHLLIADREIAPLARLHYIVNDTTYEALGVVLSDNPDGVLVVRDEMRGLLLHLGREENAAARAFYLQGWSGGRYIFKRITRGEVAIEDVRLSIIGAIQPGPLSSLIHAARRGGADDGMLERFLIAWPDDPGAWRDVDRLPDGPARRRASEAFARLDSLTGEAAGAEVQRDASGNPRGLPFLRFGSGALEAFREWRAELEAKLHTPDTAGTEAALAKFRHHVPALAVTLHLADGDTGPISTKAAGRALALADYFESHARRCYASGRRAVIRAAKAILAKVRAGSLGEQFTARDVYRPQWSALTDSDIVVEALELLEAHRWLAGAETETGGRRVIVYRPSPGARNG